MGWERSADTMNRPHKSNMPDAEKPIKTDLTKTILEDAAGKKPFSETIFAYLIAFGIGFVAPPLGPIASPLALFLSNRKGEHTNNKGQKITPQAMWMAGGVVITPILLVANVFLFPAAQSPADKDRAIHTKCQELIIGRLREPSSYQRISSGFFSSRDGVAERGVAISYRARNGFGGMTVEIADCTTETGDPQDLKITGPY